MNLKLGQILLLLHPRPVWFRLFRGLAIAIALISIRLTTLAQKKGLSILAEVVRAGESGADVVTSDPADRRIADTFPPLM